MISQISRGLCCCRCSFKFCCLKSHQVLPPPDWTLKSHLSAPLEHLWKRVLIVGFLKDIHSWHFHAVAGLRGWGLTDWLAYGTDSLCGVKLAVAVLCCLNRAPGPWSLPDCASGKAARRWPCGSRAAVLSICHEAVRDLLRAWVSWKIRATTHCPAITAQQGA